MPLYVTDWDRKTTHLDCEQDGAYGRLVRNYWNNGAPPDDDADLARIVRMPLARWRKIRAKIAPFFVIKDGRWLHERVEEELATAEDIIRKRREAGLQGGRPKKQMVSVEKPNGSSGEKQTETPARVNVLVRDVVAESPKEALQEEISQKEPLGDGTAKLRVVRP
jgi:uncharacterized protein YdaU (DUF1376 family)